MTGERSQGEMITFFLASLSAIICPGAEKELCNLEDWEGEVLSSE